MKSIRTLIIPFGLFLLAFAGAIVLQNNMIDRWHKAPRRFRDTLYIPSTEYARIVAFGYNQFMADFLWLRMIQVFAASWSSAESPTQIKTYSDVISALDPRFNDPYIFAIMGIGEEGRNQSRIVEQNKIEKNEFGVRYLKVREVEQIVKDIVDRAIVKNPGDYEIPFAGAFFAYWSLNDPALAKYYVRMAKKDPNYPDYIDRWEGFLDLKQGRYRAAYEKFLGDYITTIRGKNKDLYSINRMQLNRAINEWFVDEIRQRATEWKKTHGQYPTMEELHQAGAFKGVELPDVLSLHRLLAAMHLGEANFNLSETEVSKLAQDNIRKWDNLPLGPYDLIDPRRFRGYVIWRTMRPDDEKFIIPTLEAQRTIQGFIQQVQADNAEARKRGQKPSPFSAFEPSISKTDPFGNAWVYDEAKGELSDPAFPGIEKMVLPDLFMNQ